MNDSELNHRSPAVQSMWRQRTLNLLFHFKSDTSEESLGNCLFHYVVSLNNAKVDVSLSVSLSFSWKEKQHRKPQAVLELDWRKQVLQPIKFLLHLCVTIVWQVYAWSSPSLFLTPCEALLDSFSILFFSCSFKACSNKLVRCLQSLHSKAFACHRDYFKLKAT